MARAAESNAEYPQPRDVVFQAAAEAVSSTPKMRLLAQDPAAGRLEASTSWSMRSWGERITVEVTEVAPGRSRVAARSRTRGIQFIDWGINRENVETVLAGVSRVLSSTGTGSP